HPGPVEPRRPDRPDPRQRGRDELGVHPPAGVGGGGRPVGPGEALCPEAFTVEALEDKERQMGIGFQGLYRLNPIPRGGTFFERVWFGVPYATVPPGGRWVRYWDLASSRDDSACYTSGVLLGEYQKGEFREYVVSDVVRGRWSPADRNDVLL